MSTFWWIVLAGGVGFAWYGFRRASAPAFEVIEEDPDDREVFVPTRRSRSVAVVRGTRASTSNTSRYRIEYVDAYGEFTERTISVLAVAEEPATAALYLRAFCELRNDDRTFRVDRIRRAIRLSDGSVLVDPVGHFRSTAGTFAGGMQWWGGRGPEQIREKDEHNRIMARARPGLSALIWLALTDGEISEEEFTVMFDWIAYRARASRDGRTKWDRDAARQWIRTARPTLADISGGLSRMGKAETVQFRSAMATLAEAASRRDAAEEGRMAQIGRVLRDD